MAPPGDRAWGAREASRGNTFRRLRPNKAEMVPVRVLPGGYYVTANRKEVVVTVLGSCVSACIRAPHSALGGMNHFMLPKNPRGGENGTHDAMRYGNHAMEVLINELLASGSRREDLEVKIFGGANLNISAALGSEIGTGNAKFVVQYLRREGMAVSAHHLGGSRPRRIHYYPATGRVRMLLLDRPAFERVAAEERRLQEALRQRPAAGDIELF
jgi:chemotaxis protein CheD